MPQLVFQEDGSFKSVEPHNWGITIAQCRDLMQKVRMDPAHIWDPNYSIADLIKYYVGPWTAARGVGYAVLVNADAPKEVNVMVSHTWLENAEEFFASLERSVSDNDVMYICALANYQHDDGFGPTVAQQLGETAEESPFRKVLEHIAARRQSEGWTRTRVQVLRALPMSFLTAAIVALFPPMFFQKCAPTLDGCAALESVRICPDRVYFLDHEWRDVDIWPVFLWCFPLSLLAVMLCLVSTLLRWLVRPYNGRMVAVPCGETDLYGRLWCVYEIFSAGVLQVPVELGSNLWGTGNDEVRLSMEINQIRDVQRWNDEVRAAVQESLAQTVADAVGWSGKSRAYVPLWGTMEVIPMGRESAKLRVDVTPPGVTTGEQVHKRLERGSLAMAKALTQRLMQVSGLSSDATEEIVSVIRTSTSQSSSRVVVRNVESVVHKRISPAQAAVCAIPEDMRRIRGEIEKRALDAGLSAEAGYKMVDLEIKETLALHNKTLTYCFCRLSIILFCTVLIRGNMYKVNRVPPTPNQMYDVGYMLAMFGVYPVMFRRLARVVFRKRGRITLKQLLLFALKCAWLLPCIPIGNLIRGTGLMSRSGLSKTAAASGLRNLFSGLCIGAGYWGMQSLLWSALLVFFGGVCMPVLNLIGRCIGERWRAQLIPWFVIIPFTVLFVSILWYPSDQWMPTLVMTAVDGLQILVVSFTLKLLVCLGVRWELTPMCCRAYIKRRKARERPGIVSFIIKDPLRGHVHYARVLESATVGFCISAFCERCGVDDSHACLEFADGRRVLRPGETVAESGIKEGDELVYVQWAQERFGPVVQLESSVALGSGSATPRSGPPSTPPSRRPSVEV